MAYRYTMGTEEKSSDFETYPSSKEIISDEGKGGNHGFLNDSGKVKSFLSCKNCSQEFNTESQQPYLLPCLNAVCRQCVLGLLASDKSIIECPYCKNSHVCAEEGIIILPKDSTREVVLGIVRLKNDESGMECEMCTNKQKASHRCFDCSSFLCSDCVKLHSSLKVFINHSYTEIGSLLAGDTDNLKLFSCTMYCNTPGHEREIVKMFCSSKSCQKAICLLCAVSAHKTHSLCDISDAVNEKRELIKELMQIVEKRKHHSLMSLSVLEEKMSTFPNECGQLKDEIRQCFCKAKKVLEQRENELCDAVEIKQLERMASLELEKKRLSKLSDSCVETCHYIDAANKFDGHQSFLNVATCIEKRLKELQSQSSELQPSDTFEKIQFTPEELDLTRVNGKQFGELIMTKSSSSMSVATAVPTVCCVGEEITFNVKLLTPLGLFIDDEDIQICLKHDGICIKTIPLTPRKCSFVGSWKAEKSMNLIWNIISNGIEMDSPKGLLQVICFKDENSQGVDDGKKTDTGDADKTQQLLVVFKMSECEFNSFKYFGEKEGIQAFKDVAKNLNYKDGELQVFVKSETAKSELQHHYEKIKMTDYYRVPNERTNERLDSLDDIQIFESVSGTISPFLQRAEIEKTVQEFGCVLGDDKSNGTSVTATDLSNLLKLNQKLTAYLSADENSRGRKIAEEKNISDSPIPNKLPLVIKMSECEFNSFKYFGEKEDLQAFKSVANNLKYRDGERLVVVNNETTKSDLKEHYERIKIMNTDEYAVPKEQTGKIPDVVQEIQKEYPDACFYGGQSQITITSDDYAQLQMTKNALKLKVVGEQNRRRFRRYRPRRRYIVNDSDSGLSASNTEKFGDTLELKQ